MSHFLMVLEGHMFIFLHALLWLQLAALLKYGTPGARYEKIQ